MSKSEPGPVHSCEAGLVTGASDGAGRKCCNNYPSCVFFSETASLSKNLR